MVAESGHVVAGLCLDLAADRLLFGIGGAREEEVLPGQQAEFVARVVERVVLVDSAAPDPDEVEVRGDGLLETVAVALGSDAHGQARRRGSSWRPSPRSGDR